MDNRLLRSLGQKLSITSDEILQKACEYARFVGVRCGSGSLASLNMTASCSAIICLEIAAQSCGLSIDKKAAIKLSGMAPKMYTNAYKAIECIMGKQKHFSIKDLAVMFGCVSSVSLAEKVLNKYGEDHKVIDFSQPIFAAAAIYVVCRNQKVRLDKTKLINQVNEKRTMFDKVCKDLKETLDKMPVKAKEKTSKRPYAWLENSSEDNSNSNDVDSKKTRISEKDKIEKEDDDYEKWKLKMLEEI